MNKKMLMLLISDIVIIAAFGFIIYQDNKELERLKSVSETYAKENESLKIDLELMRKRLLTAENSQKNAQSKDFALLQQQKFNAMKEEIQRLKAENKPDNKEREDQVWDLALENVKFFVDIELSKRLASFGFKPEETEVCVTEYKNTLEKSKETLLQWYRNEMTDTEYMEKVLDISREFYKDMADAIGENKASITISLVLPDPNFRRMMFEGK